mmetsp:Transcript_26144/g.30368  ORF Transcript_26144/g.30368 Transcript_26144/m.30368 type:complete len:340 (+) Transcript_26144:141-1160(+)
MKSLNNYSTLLPLFSICTFMWTSQAFLTPLSSSSSSLVASSSSHIRTSSSTQLHARNTGRNGRGRYDDDDYDEYYDEDDFDDEDDGYHSNGNDEDRYRRRRQPPQQEPPTASSFFNPIFNNESKGMNLPSTVSQSILAGVFILGIGTGVTVDSQINTSPKDLASRDAVDQAAPNPTLCTKYGASAMAFDQRVFVSFNPFNVYVAQADVKPACVLNRANAVPILQNQGLVNSKEVKLCKDNMSNTWAFVGDLNDYPQLSCVYRSEDAQNEFLSNPKYGIGEDVYDDDRETLEAKMKSSGKLIKNGMTQGEKEQVAVKAKAMALKSKNDNLLLEKELQQDL